MPRRTSATTQRSAILTREGASDLQRLPPVSGATDEDVRDFLTAAGLPPPDGEGADLTVRQYAGGDLLALARVYLAVLRAASATGRAIPEELLAQSPNLVDAVALARGYSEATGGAVAESSESDSGGRMQQWPRRSVRVELRPPEAADYDRIYRVINSPATGWRWPSRGRTIARTELERSVSGGAALQMIGARRDNYRPVALYSIVNANDLDRRGEFSVFGLTYQTSDQVDVADFVGLEGLEGLAMFLSFAFETLGFDKLFAEVPGWNWGQFRAGEGHFFELEGVRRQHDYFAGRKWDRYLLAIFREQWAQIEVALKTALVCLDIEAPP